MSCDEHPKRPSVAHCRDCERELCSSCRRQGFESSRGPGGSGRPIDLCPRCWRDIPDEEVEDGSKLAFQVIAGVVVAFCLFCCVGSGWVFLRLSQELGFVPKFGSSPEKPRVKLDTRKVRLGRRYIFACQGYEETWTVTAVSDGDVTCRATKQRPGSSKSSRSKKVAWRSPRQNKAFHEAMASGDFEELDLPGFRYQTFSVTDHWGDRSTYAFQDGALIFPGVTEFQRKNAPTHNRRLIRVLEASVEEAVEQPPVKRFLPKIPRARPKILELATGQKYVFDRRTYLEIWTVDLIRGERIDYTITRRDKPAGKESKVGERFWTPPRMKAYQRRRLQAAMKASGLANAPFSAAEMEHRNKVKTFALRQGKVVFPGVIRQVVEKFPRYNFELTRIE